MLNYMQNTVAPEKLARWLQALGHPNRVLIFDLLMEGVQCNCEIHERLGLSLSLISHHMRLLEEAELVTSERDPVDARWIYYSVNREALEHLTLALGDFLDATRIQPRQPCCGPSGCGAQPQP
jgi:ArsR family transcriptional regulator, arsenate/arsenite/antimonite-responsive transcriptional repressor